MSLIELLPERAAAELIGVSECRLREGRLSREVAHVHRLGRAFYAPGGLVGLAYAMPSDGLLRLAALLEKQAMELRRMAAARVDAAKTRPVRPWRVEPAEAVPDSGGALRGQP